MLVMLANSHQKLWIMPIFQHLRQTKTFFQFVEMELPLVTLEQGRVRSLPEFGETGTVAIINNNNPHAMLFLLHEMANRKTHWFVPIFVLGYLLCLGFLGRCLSWGLPY